MMNPFDIQVFWLRVNLRYLSENITTEVNRRNFMVFVIEICNTILYEHPAFSLLNSPIEICCVHFVKIGSLNNETS